MGNYCASARERYMVNTRMARVKATDQLAQAKLMAKGYALNRYTDNGETKVISDFETGLVLGKVALDDFTRRLDTLGKTHVTMQELVELFGNHQYLKELSDPQSHARRVLEHPCLKEDERIVVAYLKIVAVLVCASSKKLRAETLYSVVKPVDNNVVGKELIRPVFRKMLEVAFGVMVETHAGVRPEEARTQWVLSNMDELYEEIIAEELMAAIYGREEKLVDEVFIFKFMKERPDLLKAYELRRIVFGHVIDYVFSVALDKDRHKKKTIL